MVSNKQRMDGPDISAAQKGTERHIRKIRGLRRLHIGDSDNISSLRT